MLSQWAGTTFQKTLYDVQRKFSYIVLPLEKILSRKDKVRL